MCESLRESCEKPKEMAMEYVHDVVMSLLDEESSKKRVLDAAAGGEGALTLKLVERGFSVTPVDIKPVIFKVKDVSCRRYAPC